MELEPRTTAPAHATGAVEFVPLAAVADDATFRLREEGDVAALAGSIGRLGQLVPIELRPLPGTPEGGRPRFQVVSGFRRLAALRLLMRDRVLARVHRTLSDEDAWALALGPALLTEPLAGEALDALRARVAALGVAGWADELIDEAIVRAPVEPEMRERFFEFLGGEPVPGDAEAADGGVDAAGDDAQAGGDPDAPVEVTPEELALGIATRMYEVNQDLEVASEAWRELPEEGRRAILAQARYVAALLPLLEREDAEADEGEGDR